MKSHILAVAIFLGTVPVSAPAWADDHPSLNGPLRAFHDVLQADWHMAAGPSRNRAACANVGQYIVLSRDLAANADRETAASAGWKRVSRGLVDASLALGAYCSSGMDENVVAGLSTLHNRFHDLMKLTEVK